MRDHDTSMGKTETQKANHTECWSERRDRHALRGSYKGQAVTTILESSLAASKKVKGAATL